jgi:DNA-binding CsgD family transcriptional regulator
VLHQTHPSRFAASYILHILRRACGVDEPARCAAAQLPAPAGKRRRTDHLLLVAMPLPPARAGSGDGQAAMLIVLGADPMRPMPSEIFKIIFNLSPAEIRLLLLLSGRHSMRKAAETLSISVETARSQLKSIFHKTGIRRQQELMRLTTRLNLLTEDPAPESAPAAPRGAAARRAAAQRLAQ